METKAIDQGENKTDDSEISLLELLITLARRKKFIVGITVISIVMAMGYVSQAPTVYKATTRMQLPTDSMMTAEELIKGSSLLKRVADRLVLDKAYGHPPLPDMLRILRGSVSGSAKKQIFTIDATGNTPELAVSIANAVAEELQIQLRQDLLREGDADQNVFAQEIENAQRWFANRSAVQSKSASSPTYDARPLDEYKLQDALMEELVKQYAAGKMAKGKQIQLVKILHSAEVYEIEPVSKRGKVVVLVGLMACFLAMIWVLAASMFARLTADDAIRSQLSELRHLLGWRR